jgi:uncharacterized membrane protein YtjA (UPF0391 family)
MLGFSLTLLLVAISAIAVVLTGVGGLVAAISKIVFLVTLCLTVLALLLTRARVDPLR